MDFSTKNLKTFNLKKHEITMAAYKEYKKLKFLLEKKEKKKKNEYKSK